jgi:hypothetical protein
MPEVLTAEDLLAGTAAIHDVALPRAVLEPGSDHAGPAGVVRLRALSVGAMMLVSRAARDEPELGPILLVKEALVEPQLTVEELRALPVGLMHFLVASVNTVSGLSADGDVLDGASLLSPMARIHLLLAREFGWSAEQVAALTPGQIAIYLAGIERLARQDEPADPQAQRTVSR